MADNGKNSNATNMSTIHKDTNTASVAKGIKRKNTSSVLKEQDNRNCQHSNNVPPSTPPPKQKRATNNMADNNNASSDVEHESFDNRVVILTESSFSPGFHSEERINERKDARMILDFCVDNESTTELAFKRLWTIQSFRAMKEDERKRRSQSSTTINQANDSNEKIVPTK